MTRTTIHFLIVLCCVSLLASLGCGGSPPRVDPPTLDAASAGEKAVSLYDKDGDGALSKAELQKCPALTNTFAAVDNNSDNKLSADEIADRVREWQTSQVGLMSFHCIVTLDGQPLEGGDVKLVPEPFLGEHVKGASGRTAAGGVAVIAVTDQDLPAELHGLAGVYCGFYRAEVTHPSKKIPAKYNTETTLGIEIAMGQGSRDSIRFDLRSR